MTARVVVKEGKTASKDVGAQIVAASVAEKASAIVLGARRQGGLAKSLLGSVSSEYVLGHADLPVVITRKPTSPDD